VDESDDIEAEAAGVVSKKYHGARRAPQQHKSGTQVEATAGRAPPQHFTCAIVTPGMVIAGE
jgi:hypothetical protein